MYNWKDVFFFQTQLNVKVNYKPPASAQQHTGGGDAQQIDAEGGKNNFFIHLFMFVNLCDFVHRSMHTNYFSHDSHFWSLSGSMHVIHWK